MWQKILLGGLLAWLMSCAHEPAATAPSLAAGRWRFVLQLAPEVALPFIAELTQQGAGYGLTIHNAEERLPVDTVLLRGDSVRIRLAVFDSEFRGTWLDSTHLQGHWHDYSRGADYAIPFTATRSEAPRLASQGTSAQLASRYAATFSPGTEAAYPAVGTFAQQQAQVTGTFLTETGDYRYLDGAVDGDTLRLSAFDGSHAFLFTAAVAGDSLRDGVFYSGNHWREPWGAVADPDAALRDPDALTYLKPGYDSLAFAFPNQAGERVALSDPRFQDKVVIVQLLGSWCPNCMDETRLFAHWYDRYHAQGLEIIGLAFERAGDSATAWRSLARMRDALEVHYPILLAANSPKKTDAAAALPMLNHVMSFPTSIYLDRDGQVRKVHTGFYGPGTGAPYLRFVEQYEAFLQELLAE